MQKKKYKQLALSGICSTLVLFYPLESISGVVLHAQADESDSLKITGVTANGIYNESKTIRFNQGTAKLNGVEIQDGYVVKEDGRYILEVTDSKLKTITVPFIIDLTPPEVIYHVSTKDPTNSSVNITAEFKDEYGVKRTKIPGGQYITALRYSSDMTENGEYKFTVEDYAGNTTTETVVINNIDKEIPVLGNVDSLGDQDTVITGKAEPFSNVIACILYDEIGRAVTDENGNFSIPIPAHPNGRMINVHAEDQAGNHSKYIVVTVKDNTPPVVEGVENNRIYGEDVFIHFQEGWATLNGAYIESGKQVSQEGEHLLRISDYVGNTTTVKFSIDKTPPMINGVSNGEYTNQDVKLTVSEGTAELNGQPFTTGATIQDEGTYTLVAKDEVGNVSEVAFTIDKTIPTRPTVQPVTDQSFQVIGEAEPESTVEVYNGLTVLGSYEVSMDGHYQISIPRQVAGTNLTIKTTDKAGNKSVPVTTVVTDVTAPDKVIVVNEVSDNSTFVEGKAEAGSTVKLFNGKSLLVSTIVSQSGIFKITIPPQKAGSVLTFIAEDGLGNISEETSLTVIDATPPVLANVVEVTDQMTWVTGTTEAGADITLTVGSKHYKATADEKGNFKVSIPKQTAGNKLTITIADAAGNVSKGSIITVKDKTAPKIEHIALISNKSKEVIGSAEAGSTITVVIGSKSYIAKTGVKGNFKVEIPTQKAGTKLTVIAMDAAGNKSEVKRVTVQDKIAPSIPTISSVSNLTKILTGKTEGKATVTVKIGKKQYSAKADSKGTFKVKIPVQKAGTKLTVTAKDAAGNVSTARTVTVIDKIAPAKPKVSTNVKSTTKTVSGTAEAYSKVKIKVGKKVISTGTADKKGKFIIKIKAQKKKTVLYVTATDKANNVSKVTSIKVK